MAIDNKVSIEIVLDDGSVKRGFATIKKEADTTGKQVEKDLGKGFEAAPKNLTDLAAGFFLVQQAIQVAGQAFRQAFDFVQAGERARALELQFFNLAESAGLAGQILVRELEQAADGLIDTGDLLEIAGVRIVQLGENAQRLPEILNAARTVSFALGRDFEQTFDSLAQAIATGNERLLRQSGIVVDLNTAYQKYATSIGLTADKLTDAQRQTVALSTVVQQVEQRFQGVDQSLTPISTSLQRLNAQVQNLLGNLSEGAAGVSARPLTGVADALTSATQSANLLLEANLNNEKALQAQIEIAEAALRGFQQRLEQANAIQNQTLINQFQASIAQEQERLNLLRARQTVEAEDERRRQNAAQADIVLADLASQAEARRAESLRLSNEEKKKAEELSLRQQALDAQAIASIQQQTTVINANSAALGSASESASNFTEGFTAELATLTTAVRAELGAQQLTYGALARTINQGFTQAFAAVGAAFARGEDAGKAFGDTIKQTLGALAIQIGQFFIAVGAGMSATGALFGLSGGAAIAAGAALIALGGALQASGGASSQTAAVGSTTVGPGQDITPDVETIFPAREEERAREPNTVINVSFEGDVIGDSADTGARIVSLINNAFDRQGVVLRQGVV